MIHFLKETYKISAKLISSKESLDFSQNAIEPAEAEELLHSLAEQRDVMIKSFDPLNKQIGEIARIENTQMENDQFNGLVITYDTELIGLKIGSNIEVSFAGLAKNQKPPASQILTFSGDSQIKHLGSDANGHYYLFTTLQQMINMQAAENISNPWLDSTIRTSINYPKARSVPGMPTHVYSPYGNTLIEVKGIPSGELMSDPAYPDADGKIFRVP